MVSIFFVFKLKGDFIEGTFFKGNPKGTCKVYKNGEILEKEF
jgi:hypothetical protein